MTKCFGNNTNVLKIIYFFNCCIITQITICVKNLKHIRWLGRAIWVSLKEHRRQWVSTSGHDVERLMSGDPPLPCEAWMSMRVWYKAAVDHTPPPY